MKRLVSLLLIAAFALVGCSTGDAVDKNADTYSFTSPGGKTKIFYPPAQRKRLPELEGSSVRSPNKRIKLSDYRGKPMVINVWGSWCGPCRNEAPDLQAAVAKFGGRVQMLGVDVRDNRQSAEDFLNTHGLHYPSIFDPAGRALLSVRNYPFSAVPTTMVLDKQHRVAAMFLVPLTQSDIRPLLTKLTGSSR